MGNGKCMERNEKKGRGGGRISGNGKQRKMKCCEEAR